MPSRGFTGCLQRSHDHVLRLQDLILGVKLTPPQLGPRSTLTLALFLTRTAPFLRSPSRFPPLMLRTRAGVVPFFAPS